MRVTCSYDSGEDPKIIHMMRAALEKGALTADHTVMKMFEAQVRIALLDNGQAIRCARVPPQGPLALPLDFTSLFG